MSNLDEALERLHLGDLEYAGGLANHGPMAAEALEHIGHPSLIPALLDSYAPRLPPAARGRAISDSAWRGALGVFERRADWVCSFEGRLESELLYIAIAEPNPWMALERYAKATAVWSGVRNARPFMPHGWDSWSTHYHKDIDEATLLRELEYLSTHL